jgi:hypothetical protein
MVALALRNALWGSMRAGFKTYPGRLERLCQTRNALLSAARRHLRAYRRSERFGALRPDLVKGNHLARARNYVCLARGLNHRLVALKRFAPLGELVHAQHGLLHRPD